MQARYKAMKASRILEPFADCLATADCR